MQLSREEYLRISDINAAGESHTLAVVGTGLRRQISGEGMLFDPRFEQAQQLADTLGKDSDDREEIIRSLRERIAAGEYTISGEMVAEMIFRRVLADRIEY